MKFPRRAQPNLFLHWLYALQKLIPVWIEPQELQPLRDTGVVNRLAVSMCAPSLGGRLSNIVDIPGLSVSFDGRETTGPCRSALRCRWPTCDRRDLLDRQRM